MMTTEQTLLTGDLLANWLETQEQFFFQNEQNLEREDLERIMSETLLNTPCEPDDDQLVYRYHRLWLSSGHPEKALEVLERFAEPSSQHLNAEQKAMFMIYVSLWKTQIYFDLDREKLVSELDHLIAFLLAQPNQEHFIDLWQKTLETCEYGNVWDRYRIVAKHRIAAEQRFAKDEPDFVQGQLWLFGRECRAFAAEENNEGLFNSATKILTLLKDPHYSAQIDQTDWLTQANSLVYYVPSMIDEMIAHIRQYALDSWHAAKKRDLEVRILQLRAKQSHAKGNLQEAIELGLAGHFKLRADRNDYFTAGLIDWLVEADDLDRAGEIAFNSVRAKRAYSGDYALQVAQQYRESKPSFYWHIILAWKSLDNWLEAKAALATSNSADSNSPQANPQTSQEELNAFYQSYLNERALAEAIKPEHHGLISMDLELLYAEKLYSEQQTLDAQTFAKRVLALAERFWQLPDSPKSPRWVESVLHARAELNGIESVLNDNELVICDGAEWNFFISNQIFRNSQEELDRYHDYADAIIHFAAKYQALTIKQIEHFIETGKGHFLDGDIHDYSMILNNHAIYYNLHHPKTDETATQDYLYAIELNRRGIQISPFAEHYDMVLSSCLKLKRDEDILQAAEDLWHYASEHGYSRHDPTWYAAKIADILERLGRSREIQIWIDRMDLWFSWLSPEQQVEQNQSYCYTTLYLLTIVVDVQPDEAFIRLQKEIARAEPYFKKDIGFTINIALICRLAGNIQEAIKYYEITLENSLADQYERGIELAERNLKELKGSTQSAPSKPWWKFW